MILVRVAVLQRDRAGMRRERIGDIVGCRRRNDGDADLDAERIRKREQPDECSGLRRSIVIAPPKGSDPPGRRPKVELITKGVEVWRHGARYRED